MSDLRSRSLHLYPEAHPSWAGFRPFSRPAVEWSSLDRRFPRRNRYPAMEQIAALAYGGTGSQEIAYFSRLLTERRWMSPRCTIEANAEHRDEMEETFQLALVVAFAAVLLVTGQFLMDYRSTKIFNGSAIAAAAQRKNPWGPFPKLCNTVPCTEIGVTHKLMEVIDAPIDARR